MNEVKSCSFGMFGAWQISIMMNVFKLKTKSLLDTQIGQIEIEEH